MLLKLSQENIWFDRGGFGNSTVPRPKYITEKKPTTATVAASSSIPRTAEEYLNSFPEEYYMQTLKDHPTGEGTLAEYGLE